MADTLSAMKRERAIERWHELLSSRHLTSTIDHLLEGTTARRLVWDGRPACSTLRPKLVEATAHAEAVSASELVTRGLQRAFDLLREQPALRARLALDPALETLCQIDLDDPEAAAVVGRLDGFFDRHDRIRFVEYNPFPGGIFIAHGLGEIFAGMPLYEELARECSLRLEAPLDALLPSLRRALSSTGGRLPAVGYILCHPDDGFKAAGQEMPQLGELVTRAGGSACFGRAEEFELVGDRLLCRGTPIDLVGCDDHALLARRHGLDHPAFVAARRRVARFLNGLAHAFTLGSKALFALLTDEELAPAFDPATWHALQAHLPWTRVVEERHTIHAGQRVDLLELIVEQRDRLVLKPAMSHGGEGVVLGREAGETRWQEALAAARETPYVVQERVDIPVETFPILAGGSVTWAELMHDSNPYVWNNTAASGYAVRLSSQSIVNVSAGGSVAPLFVLGG